MITSFIWGIKIDTYLHDTFWDLTTLVLKKELNNTKDLNKYLDMGCGQFAILGQYYKKINTLTDVTSVDIYEKFVENSIQNSTFNKNDIKVKKSNLFSDLDEKYDLITFNPPMYHQQKIRITRISNIRYSELDGIKTAKDFLIEAKIF